MRTRLVLLVSILVVTPLHASAAQRTARDSVVATIQRVLDAMRARDTTGLGAAFDSTARLIGVPDASTAATRPRTASRFLADIANVPPEKAFDERIYDPEVRIEGPVAQVWTYYTFREGKTFSHCGIDAFTLMRTGGTWRIVNWIWTMRRVGCTHTE